MRAPDAKQSRDAASRAAAMTTGSGLGHTTTISRTPATRAGTAVISSDEGSGKRPPDALQPTLASGSTRCWIDTPGATSRSQCTRRCCRNATRAMWFAACARAWWIKSCHGNDSPMKAFLCPTCSQPVFFENDVCLRCSDRARVRSRAAEHGGDATIRRGGASTPTSPAATGWCRSTIPSRCASPAGSPGSARRRTTSRRAPTSPTPRPPSGA